MDTEPWEKKPTVHKLPTTVRKDLNSTQFRSNDLGCFMLAKVSFALKLFIALSLIFTLILLSKVCAKMYYIL